MSINEFLTSTDFTAKAAELVGQFEQLSVEERNRTDMQRAMVTWVVRHGAMNQPVTQYTTYMRYLWAIIRATELGMKKLDFRTEPLIYAAYMALRPDPDGPAQEIFQDQLVWVLALTAQLKDPTLSSVNSYMIGACSYGHFEYLMTTVDKALGLLEGEKHQRFLMGFDFISLPPIIVEMFVGEVTALEDTLEFIHDEEGRRAVSAEWVEGLYTKLRSQVLYA